MSNDTFLLEQEMKRLRRKVKKIDNVTSIAQVSINKDMIYNIQDKKWGE